MTLLQLWCLSILYVARATTELSKQVQIKSFFFDVALAPVQTGVVFLCPSPSVCQAFSSYASDITAQLVPLVRQHLGYELQTWNVQVLPEQDLINLQKSGTIATKQQLLIVESLLCDLERKGIAPFSQQGLACLIKNQHEVEFLANPEQALVCREANTELGNAGGAGDAGNASCAGAGDVDFDPKWRPANGSVRAEGRIFFDRVFDELLAEIFSAKQVAKRWQEVEEQLSLYQKNLANLAPQFGLVSFGGTIGTIGVPIEVISWQLPEVQEQSTPQLTTKQQCFVDINDILLPCSVVVSEQDLLTLRALRKVAYRVPPLSGQMSAYAWFTAPYFELLWGTAGVATVCFGSERDASYVTCAHMFVPSGLCLPEARQPKMPNYCVTEWHFDNQQVRCNFSVDREYLLFEQHSLVIGVGEPPQGTKLWEEPFALGFNATVSGNYYVSLEQLGYIYNSYCFTFCFWPVSDFSNLAGCQLYGGSAPHQGIGGMQGSNFVAPASESTLIENSSMSVVTESIEASALKAAVKEPRVTSVLESVTVPVIDFEAAVLESTDFSEQTSTTGARAFAVDVVKSAESKSIESACLQVLQPVSLTLPSKLYRG